MSAPTDDIFSIFNEADSLIDQGNPEGYALLGEAHYLQGDFDNATIAFEKAIELGNARAMYDLALMCYDGLVDNSNYDWYDAERFMTMCYNTGTDMATDAAVWLGEYFLESTEGDDPEFGIDYLQYAADKKNSRALELLADYFFSRAEDKGFEDESLNAKAFQYQQDAYEVDPHEQSYNYGYLLYFGIGTPQNIRLALKLYEENYEFGHHEGAEALMEHYEKEGMKKEALWWKERAIKAKQKRLEQDN
ncbi:MAG: hypothetical protein ACI30S_01315 [Muribaculaceae bacterium]